MRGVMKTSSSVFASESVLFRKKKPRMGMLLRKGTAATVFEDWRV